MGKKKYRATPQTKAGAVKTAGINENEVAKETEKITESAAEKIQQETKKNAKGRNVSDGEVITADRLRTRRNATAYERASQVFACLMFAVFPMLIGQGKYTNITETKYYWFIGLTAAFLFMILALAIAYIVLDKWYVERKAEGRQKLLPIQIVILVYMVWAVISAIASGHGICHDTIIGQSRFEALLSIWLYGITFVLISLWGEFTEKYSYAAAVMAIVFGFICFLQSCGSTMIYPEGYCYWDINFTGTIGNIDCVSGLIATFLPMLAASFVIFENKWRWLMVPGVVLFTYIQSFIDVDSGKLGLIAAAVMTLPFIVDTKKKASRSALIYAVIAVSIGLEKWLNPTREGFQPYFGKTAALLFIGAVVLAVISVLLSKKDGEFSFEPAKIRKAAWIAIVVLVIIALLFIYFYNGTITLLQEASAILHGQLNDEAGTLRGYIYKATWQCIKTYGLIGAGPGCFYEAFYPYNAGYNVYAPNQVVDYAHCDLLQIATCEGIIGLIIYLVFVGMLAYMALKNAGRCPVVVILAGGCVGFLIHSWFSFSIAIVSPPFWIMAGLLVKCIRQIPEKKQTAKQSK